MLAADELVLISTGGADCLEPSRHLTKIEDGFKYSGRKVFGSGSPAGHLLVTTGVYDWRGHWFSPRKLGLLKLPGKQR